MVFVSVIVPVYNVEKYITRCVDSVLTQSFTDFEMILVDDGSPDNSPFICDEYAKTDKRIRVIHKENGGLSSARNIGISAAKGLFLFFLDSDDMIHPDCLQILNDCVNKTGAEIAVGEFTRFNANENPDFSSKWDNTYYCRTNVQTLGAFFEKRESLHSLVSACGTLWKKSLFNDIRFPLGKLFEDEFITYQLYYKANRIVFTNQVCYYYYVNDEGITRTLTLEKRFDEYEAQLQRLDFFLDKDMYELAGKAAKYYLKTAQWDLIEVRNNKSIYKSKIAKDFNRQYRRVFQIAKEMDSIIFMRDYNYYVLAYPELRQFWRLKRQLFKCLNI